MCRQTGRDRIELNVGPYVLELMGAPDPMIKGFILPEVFSSATKDAVGVARAHAFNSIGNLRDGSLRTDEQVDMVRHNHKSVKGVVVQRELSTMNGLQDGSSDARVLQPMRTGAAFVQEIVYELEPFFRGVFCGTATPGCAVLVSKVSY